MWLPCYKTYNFSTNQNNTILKSPLSPLTLGVSSAGKDSGSGVKGGGLGAFSSVSSMGPASDARDLDPPRSREDLGRWLVRESLSFGKTEMIEQLICSLNTTSIHNLEENKIYNSNSSIEQKRHRY